MKNYIISVVFFIKILSISCYSQQVNIVVSEQSLNSAIKVIKDAKAINFGDYLGKLGLNAWYVNLDDAQFDIKPNNVIVINNVKLSGGVDLNLWISSWTPTGTITGTITGEVSVIGNPNDGYRIQITPTSTDFSYSGSLSSVVNLVSALTNNFSDFIPNVEVNLGNSLLPSILLKYFKSGIPQITTDENNIILSFEVLFDNIELKNMTIASGEVRNYKASNSIIFGPGFSAEKGASLSATIVPKQQSSLKSAKVESNNLKTFSKSELSDKVFITSNPTNNESNKLENNLEIYPNPFFRELFISIANQTSRSDVSIYDTQGKIVYFKSNIKQNEQLELSSLKTGVYILRYTDKDININKQIIKLK